MTREEFEEEMRALGFVADHNREEWRRARDGLNSRISVAFDAVRELVDKVDGWTFDRALRLLREQVEGPSAVDQLADVVRTDAGEVLGLVLGAL